MRATLLALALAACSPPTPWHGSLYWLEGGDTVRQVTCDDAACLCYDDMALSVADPVSSSGEAQAACGFDGVPDVEEGT